jgi:hypothetical protein
MEVVFPTKVFDPRTFFTGVHHALYFLKLLHSEFSSIPPMHKTGYVIINEPYVETYKINSCLFDTGAQSDNYISQSYVDKYKDVFSDYIIDHNSTVRLGDSKTTVNISQIITLQKSFLDNISITHDATINLSIMHMFHLDMIIGIKSIIYTPLYDLFVDMLKTARNVFLSSRHIGYKSPIIQNNNNDTIAAITPTLCTITSDILTHNIPDHSDYIDCIPTWSCPLDAVAPEELLTPDPCSFTVLCSLLTFLVRRY